MATLRTFFQQAQQTQQVQQVQQVQQTQQTQQNNFSTDPTAQKPGAEKDAGDISFILTRMTLSPTTPTTQDLEKFRSLLKGRATNTNILDGNRTPIVLYAASNGHLEYLKALKDAGANMELTDTKTGDTALIRAVLGHHKDCALFLMHEAGCDPDKENKKGKSAKWYATYSNMGEITEIFRERTAEDINRIAHHGVAKEMTSAPVPGNIRKRKLPPTVSQE